MPAHYYPTPEPNPIKINPDGSQSPNPRYQGPNPYKKGADGKLTRIKNIKPVKPAAMGLLRNLGHLGTALSAGAGIGLWMKDNVGINTSGSGRGEGLSAFNPEKLTGTYGSLPASARVVTDYPKGIPTGLGGGNAAQAQSLDPEASAYIPPTRITIPDPTPPPAPKSEPNWVDWYQKDNDLGNKNIDEVKSHFASQSKGLGEWAEANPALAWRAYQKQMPDSMGALTEWNTDMDVDAPAQSVIPGRAERIQGSIDSLVKDSDLNPWSQQLLENLSTGNFTNPGNLKDLDIFKSDIEVPYNFDNVPTEVFSEKGLDLKYPGIFNSTYRPVI